jgi:tetratricopeptide (TPR) repeat protein
MNVIEPRKCLGACVLCGFLCTAVVHAQVPMGFGKICVSGCNSAPPPPPPPPPKTPAQLQYEKAMALNDKGLKALRDGETAEALEYFKEASELEPTNAAIASNIERAEEQLRQDKIDEAANNFNDKGLDALQRGDTATALFYFDKAGELKPEDPTFRDNRRHTLERQTRQEGLALNKKGNEAFVKGDFAAAVKYYQEAQKKLPNDPIIAQNLSQAEEQEADAEAKRDAAAARISARFETLWPSAHGRAEVKAGSATGSRAEEVSFIDERGPGKLKRVASPGARLLDDQGFVGNTGPPGSVPDGGPLSNGAYDQAVVANKKGSINRTPQGPLGKPNEPWDSNPPILPSGQGVFAASWQPLPPDRETPELKVQHDVVNAAQKREADMDAKLAAAEAAPKRDQMEVMRRKDAWNKAHDATITEQKKYNALVDRSFHPRDPKPSRQ